MFRTIIAAMLLRTTGAQVQYNVRRLHGGKSGKGTTVLRTKKYRDAKRKYKAMRVAITDTITITVEAVVAQRHGTVEAE
jgi:hypothetical protein